MIARPVAAAVFVVLALAGCTTTVPPVQSAGTGPASPSVTASSASSSYPSSAPSLTNSPPLVQVHDPGQVTGTLTGPCHAQDGGQLPDPRCTPGAYDPAITAAVLCAPGYTTRTYRPSSSQTSAFKYHAAYPAYGIPGATSAPSELDHLVSLELGGSNDAANLWPEMGPIPNVKDGTENALHAWVCQASGTAAETRLHEAQAAIAGDWITAEQVLGISK